MSGPERLREPVKLWLFKGFGADAIHNAPKHMASVAHLDRLAGFIFEEVLISRIKVAIDETLAV